MKKIAKITSNSVSVEFVEFLKNNDITLELENPDLRDADIIEIEKLKHLSLIKQNPNKKFILNLKSWNLFDRLFYKKYINQLDLIIFQDNNQKRKFEKKFDFQKGKFCIIHNFPKVNQYVSKERMFGLAKKIRLELDKKIYIILCDIKNLKYNEELCNYLLGQGAFLVFITINEKDKFTIFKRIKDKEHVVVFSLKDDYKPIIHLADFFINCCDYLRFFNEICYFLHSKVVPINLDKSSKNFFSNNPNLISIGESLSINSQQLIELKQNSKNYADKNISLEKSYNNYLTIYKNL